MSNIVMDASALIAMLRGETGADQIATSIAGACVSTVNYAEVVTHFIHAGMPAHEVDAMLDPLPLTILPADKALAKLAGRLRALTADLGLSLGDRFCLALAWQEGLTAWTADRQWQKIADAAEVRVFVFR